ncbi:probable G-protein coupled receptor 25 [Pteronotus mesoamericanus]|uniref:probable G-protein coupled receptor 25 n=1 Tax=Pteronotus mesoamericanus TaxID=1884717 RepID=UPI0023EBC0ED|nr:probable G-protein coupled receptor 25 [Pteronotus parnellii mesoamericanus]
MPATEPWSLSPETASWDYSGSGSGAGALEEELELCAFWELPCARAVVPTLYLAAFAVGLLGNGLVLRLLAWRRAPRRLADTFVLHLAAADLGLVLTLPLWAVAAAQDGHWPFGRALCKLSGFALAASRCAGALLLAGLAADRYLAVARPRGAHPRRSPRCARALCRGAWVAALLVGLPALVSRDLQPLPEGPGSQCGEKPSDAFQALGLLLLLLTCALPLGATFFCYCRLARRLRRPLGLGRVPAAPLRIICAVEGAFVGSWLPFGILRAVLHLARLGAVPLPCRLLQALRWGLTVATCLAFGHSCANPLIYLLLDRSFRVRAWRLALGLSSASSRSADPSAEARGPAESGGRA